MAPFSIPTYPFKGIQTYSARRSMDLKSIVKKCTNRFGNCGFEIRSKHACNPLDNKGSG